MPAHRLRAAPPCDRVRRELDVRRRAARRTGAKFLAEPARRERAVREAVVAAVERHHAGAVRSQRRRLQRRRHRVRPRQAEDHARPRLREETHEALAQRHFHVRGVDVTERQPEAFGLRLERARHPLGGVPEKERAEARGEIDVAVPVDVDGVRAARGGVDDRRLVRAARPSARVSPRVERGALHRRELGRERARPRPRRRHELPRRLLAARIERRGELGEGHEPGPLLGHDAVTAAALGVVELLIGVLDEIHARGLVLARPASRRRWRPSRGSLRSGR